MDLTTSQILSLQSNHLEEKNRMSEKDKLDLPVKEVISTICAWGNKYLIGRFRDDYKYCPGDWDFLTWYKVDNENVVSRALYLSKQYVGIPPIKVIKSFPPFAWLDDESKLWWLFYCFLVKVRSPIIKIKSTEKYSEFKWVKKDDISSYSRLGYLEDILNHTIVNRQSKH